MNERKERKIYKKKNYADEEGTFFALKKSGGAMAPLDPWRRGACELVRKTN